MTRQDASVVTDDTVQLTEKAWKRFWAKVNISEHCWEWTAAKNPDGYGRFGIGARLVYPHRLMAVHTYGTAVGMVVDHLCRNPSCVRPDHLELVTMRENTVRGNNATMQAHLTGVCKRGHDLTEHGYYRKGTNKLAACRQCQRVRRAERKRDAA